jgi:hypothetical protein
MKTNRLQELAGLITEGALDPANEENIFDNLIETDHSELVNKLLSAADENPSLTLVDFLKKFDIGAGEEDDLNENESLKNIKKLITSVFRKNGIKGLTFNTTDVRGFSRSSDKRGYKHEYSGLVTMKGFSEEEAKDIFKQLEDAGVKIYRKSPTSFEYDY